MQRLREPNDPVSPHACAREVLETLPLVMRAIRAELRQRPAGLSEAQFRTVFFLHHHQGASLSDVAEFHGLTPASTSRLVNGLVARGVVTRTVDAGDRRRCILALTAQGRSMLQVKMAATRDRLASLLAGTTRAERTMIASAMEALRRALVAHRAADDGIRGADVEAR